MIEFKPINTHLFMIVVIVKRGIAMTTRRETML